MHSRSTSDFDGIFLDDADCDRDQDIKYSFLPNLRPTMDCPLSTMHYIAGKRKTKPNSVIWMESGAVCKHAWLIHLKWLKRLILFILLQEAWNTSIGKEQLSSMLSLCSPYDNFTEGKIRVTVSYLHDEFATPTKS